MLSLQAQISDSPPTDSECSPALAETGNSNAWLQSSPHGDSETGISPWSTSCLTTSNSSCINTLESSLREGHEFAIEGQTGNTSKQLCLTPQSRPYLYPGFITSDDKVSYHENFQQSTHTEPLMRLTVDNLAQALKMQQFCNLRSWDTQVYPDICDHIGSCEESVCNCARNKTACRLGCKCSSDCFRLFPACMCTTRCTSYCPCNRFSRECIPGKCKCSSCKNVFNGKTPVKVAIKDSIVAGAGRGLFADEYLKKGAFLGEYIGDRIDTRQQHDIKVDKMSLFTINQSQFRAKTPE